jgi:hypothetical protein
MFFNHNLPILRDSFCKAFVTVTCNGHAWNVAFEDDQVERCKRVEVRGDWYGEENMFLTASYSISSQKAKKLGSFS